MFRKIKITLISIFTIMVMFLVACNGTDGTDSESSGTSSSEKDTVDETIETDVIVVGGGGAGLVAALTAAENGAEVILLEKMGYMGGATTLSGGIVPAADTHYQEAAGVVDSPSAMANDISRPAYFSQDQELVKIVSENSAEVVEWMGELGVKWNLQTNSLFKGQTTYRMHQAEENGVGISSVLISEINENDKITVYLETPATALVTDDNGAVTGVFAEDKDGKVLLVNGKSVILGTSGFAANKEMLAEYIPQVLNAYPVVAPGATGEGILWGEELGAKVANMSSYQGYGPISNVTKEGLSTGILYDGGIFVNINTERFTDEYLGYSEMGSVIISQPDNLAYAIFDSTVAENVSTLDQYKEDKLLYSANSTEELAEQIGLDPVKLEAVFADYTEGIKNGEDKFNRLMLPEKWEGPFYALEVTSDLRHTQGGLVIDDKARVIKEDNEPIPGLYAAGGVTAGFSSTGGPGYMSGNGLLQAFVLGRIAGVEAVNSK